MKKNDDKPVIKEKARALGARFGEIESVKKIVGGAKNFFSWAWHHEKAVAARKEAGKSTQKALVYLHKNEKTRKIV